MRKSFTLHFALFVSFLTASVAAARPNIVVFLVDDMGWQDTSEPFHTETTKLNRTYRTPNMRRLAAEGMKFTQAYAYAVCSPSRVSLLTGQSALRHQVTNWTLRLNKSPDGPHKIVSPPKWNLNGLQAESGIERTVVARTLPMHLREAGYRTIHAGKAHFGAKETPGEDPSNLGFDVNIAGHAAGGPGSYHGDHNFSAAFRKGDPIWDVPGLGAYHGKKINLTEAITIESLKAVDLALDKEQPFFLYLSHYAIHAPFEPDRRFIESYKKAGLKGRQLVLASMIESMDDSLGRVMGYLRRRGVDGETIVIFMSDNGSAPGNPINKPLRGNKLTPYEGGIRVPMMVSWPGVTKAGSVNTVPVHIDDVFPTVLEIAGLEPKQADGPIDGISFAGLCRGEDAPDADRAFYWHFPHTYFHSPYSIVRQGEWKLIYHHVDQRQELFHLTVDLGETKNLATERPNKRKELAGLLAAKLKAMGSGMPVLKTTGNPVPLPQ